MSPLAPIFLTQLKIFGIRVPFPTPKRCGGFLLFFSKGRINEWGHPRDLVYINMLMCEIFSWVVQFATSLWGRFYYCSHFTAGKTKVKGFGPNNPASYRGEIQTLTVWLYSTYSSQCMMVLGAFRAAVGKGLLVRTTESRLPIKGGKFSWGWWQSETLIIH